MIKINKLKKSDFLSYIKVKKIIDECIKYVFDNTINTNNQYKFREWILDIDVNKDIGWVDIVYSYKNDFGGNNIVNKTIYFNELEEVYYKMCYEKPLCNNEEFEQTLRDIEYWRYFNQQYSHTEERTLDTNLIE